MAMLDLTQVEVANGIRRSQAAVSAIYNFDYDDVKLTTLQRLAEFFGCTIDDIFPHVSPETANGDQPVLPFKKAAVAR